MGVAKTLTKQEIQDLRQHESIAKILDVLGSPRYQIDMTLTGEIEDYMRQLRDESNVSAASFRTDQDLQHLGGRLHEIHRIRSRVMEVKFGHTWARKSLRRLYEVGAAILRTGPIGGLSNQAARDGAISWVLVDLRARIDEFDVVIEMAEEADRHLGNAYFTLKELIAININFLEAKRNDRGS